MKNDDTEIKFALKEKAEQHLEEGFLKAYDRLPYEEKPWNHKRVRRVYLALEFSLRRKTKKRLLAKVKEPLEVPNTVREQI